MRISTTSGMNGPWFRAHRSRPSRLNREFPHTEHTYRPSHGSDIHLESDMRVDLGSINGKPLFMWNTKLGGFGWTGSPPASVQGPRPGEKVSQADIDAARLASSYTRAESEYAYKIVTVINGLYRLTQGLSSAQKLNDLLKERSIDSSVVADALGRLGVNANGTFSVSGRKVHVSDGQFVLG